MIAKQSLAVALSRLKTFDRAKMALEQYPTESGLAADLLWDAAMKGRIEGRRILDLGAGTGILAIGAALLGASEVVAVEKDADAIAVFRENLELYEGVERVRIVEADVASFREPADLVVMNPPFGTKERHADRVFLSTATKLAPVVYTVHKSSTEKFVRAFAEDEGFAITMAQQRSFLLKRSMPHHERRRQDVEVMLFCLERR